MLVTLAVLRLQVPHAALAVMYGVHRSTVTRAVQEVRPLLAGRGYATAQGRRLSALADVFAYATAHGIRLRLDGSQIQVRRPPPRQPGRRAFVSGKKLMKTGGPYNAGSADARMCQRPSRRSDHWCLTAPLPGDRPPLALRLEGPH